MSEGHRPDPSVTAVGDADATRDAAAESRGHWSTRAGFILAAVGSAVGLGNMWRFPYVTAEGGGAAFVLFYIAVTFIMGIPIMMGEFAIGRNTRLSPIGAWRKIGGRAWVPFGYLFVLTGLIILGYYSVIAGWVARYALGALFAGFPAEAGEHFNQIATGAPAIAFHIGFMALTIAIVMGGVEKGIERASLLMMPTLFVLIVGLAVWVSTMSGSGQGYAFYLTPDFGELLRFDILAEATAQAFFSLSLGMGALLTFSSYLGKKQSLGQEAGIIAFADFGVAFTAGLLVFPIVFALGLQGAIGESTVGALFIALPSGFATIGTLGRVLGAVFFIALFIGALTSAISLLEVVTSSIIDEKGVSRRTAAIGAGVIIGLLGLWPATNLDALNAMDVVAGQVFLPLGGLAVAIFVGWVMKDPLEEVMQGMRPSARPWMVAWRWLLRIAAPVFLVLVLWTTVPAGWEAVRALFGD